MTNTSTITALQGQAEHERFAATSYLAMSLWCEAADLPGFAAFFKKQCAEETEHTEKFHRYLLDLGVVPVLASMPAPRADFTTLESIASHAVDLEKANTMGIHACYESALAEKDYPTQVLLHWFISEQVEEEAWTAKLLAMVRRATCAGGVTQLDRHIMKDMAG